MSHAVREAEECEEVSIIGSVVTLDMFVGAQSTGARRHPSTLS